MWQMVWFGNSTQSLKSSTQGSHSKGTSPDFHRANFLITNVRLAHSDPELANKLWTVECREGKVNNVTPYTGPLNEQSRSFPCYEVDAQGSIMLPSLCHSHIHLDKCFLLDRCDLSTGDFKEAMRVTGTAKAAFRLEKDDLIARGRKLIRDSLDCGVTSMRAHVEIDILAGFSGLDVACLLKEESKVACYIQIAAFAQEGLFPTAGETEPGPNYHLLLQAIERREVEAVGSAPYVEPSIEQAKKNIALILELAGRYSLHADFHLDYNLDPNSEPLIYEVIAQARRLRRYWLPAKGLPKRRITIGHATRLQLFTPAQWRDLADAIGELPITIIGLPNSDMYMQGREHTHTPLGAPRGTLRVPYLAEKYGFQIAMSVNNVENAFTPQGSVDPLGLCTFGAAVFQAATTKDIRTLMRSVTITSKRAIGQDCLPVGLCPRKGDPADFVIIHGTKTLKQAVLNPAYDRTTIRQGLVVARRQTKKWATFKEPPIVRFTIPWYRQLRWWWYAFFPVTWPYFAYKWIFCRRIHARYQHEDLEWEEQDSPMYLHDHWYKPRLHQSHYSAWTMTSLK